MENLINSAHTISLEIKKLKIKKINKIFKEIFLPNTEGINYCISLFEEYFINPNEEDKIFLYDLGQELINFLTASITNGYPKLCDVHHGTEIFLGYLSRYTILFPEDERASSLIINAAEFIGNWKNESVSWYDYEKNNFKSWQLGCNGYNKNPLFQYNTADHLRFIHLAILAWEISGNSKYLDWSLLYGKSFANRIIKSENSLPVAWDNNNKEYYSKDMKSTEEKYLSASHHHLDNNSFAGVENLIASGAIHAFGNLYKISKDTIFFEASKKIINCLIEVIDKPYSDPASSLISYYRDTYFDFSFDERIIEKLKKISAYNKNEIFLTMPEQRKIRMSGIGNRKDMIYWNTLENGQQFSITEPPSSFFILAYQITNEIKYAERALDFASRKVKLASLILRQGVEHADAGCSLSSIISGHGRNWGVGPVTGCYPILTIGSDLNFSLPKSIIKFLTPTISNGCMPFVRKLKDHSIEINIHNYSEQTNNIKFIYSKNNENISVNLEPKTGFKKILL